MRICASAIQMKQVFERMGPGEKENNAVACKKQPDVLCLGKGLSVQNSPPHNSKGHRGCL